MLYIKIVLKMFCCAFRCNKYRGFVSP